MRTFRVRPTDDNELTWCVADGFCWIDTEWYIDRFGKAVDRCIVFSDIESAEAALNRYQQNEKCDMTKTEPTAEFVQDGEPIRTFDTGATRDTAQGKLDYVKALSPIVLKRYVEYLDKHRLQPDGSYRDFDNWKQGIPQDVYHSSGGRHFVDAWLLTEGYVAEDNHGSVELEDAICAQIFNAMGLLHEILKERGYCRPDRTQPVEGGY